MASFFKWKSNGRAKELTSPEKHTLAKHGFIHVWEISSAFGSVWIQQDVSPSQRHISGQMKVEHIKSVTSVSFDGTWITSKRMDYPQHKESLFPYQLLSCVYVLLMFDTWQTLCNIYPPLTPFIDPKHRTRRKIVRAQLTTSNKPPGVSRESRQILIVLIYH